MTWVNGFTEIFWWVRGFIELWVLPFMRIQLLSFFSYLPQNKCSRRMDKFSNFKQRETFLPLSFGQPFERSQERVKEREPFSRHQNQSSRMKFPGKEREKTMKWVQSTGNREHWKTNKAGFFFSFCFLSKKNLQPKNNHPPSGNKIYSNFGLRAPLSPHRGNNSMV